MGARIGDVSWTPETALVTILRGGRVLTPEPDNPLEAGDELLFVTGAEQEAGLERMLAPQSHP